MSSPLSLVLFYLFFFNDTATTEIYTLSLHDALPISICQVNRHSVHPKVSKPITISGALGDDAKHYQIRAVKRAVEESRSEEHTSELQSHSDLVCRLLLEKKKKKKKENNITVT